MKLFETTLISAVLPARSTLPSPLVSPPPVSSTNLDLLVHNVDRLRTGEADQGLEGLFWLRQGNSYFLTKMRQSTTTKVILFFTIVICAVEVGLCQDKSKDDAEKPGPSPADLQTPTALFKCSEDDSLKAIEEYLDESDSVEDQVNCITENLDPCSGGSSSKCCDKVGAKLKEIGLIVFGPRSLVKECGLLDQECRCQRRTAAKLARTFATKFSSDFVHLQAHFKGNETDTPSK